jgi:predicted metal-dependent phosphoesterase TrpH
MLELHCHTTCSDGTLTPKQLVHAAVRAGVSALAITDHDTISGWSEAMGEAQHFCAKKMGGGGGREVLGGEARGD